MRDRPLPLSLLLLTAGVALAHAGCGRYRVQNGLSEILTDARGQQTAYVECEAGLHLRPEHKDGATNPIACNNDRWSHTVICAKPCPTPPTLENGSKDNEQEHYFEEDEVGYSCDSLYKPKRRPGANNFRTKFICVRFGNLHRWVPKNKHWTNKRRRSRWQTQNAMDKLPICTDAVVCPHPGQVHRGASSAALKPQEGVEGVDGFFFPDESITYSCTEPGDTLEGAPTLTCSRAGTWSSEKPACRPAVRCPQPEAVPHSSLGPTARYYGPGDRVTYKCHQSYYIDVSQNEDYIYEDYEDAYLYRQTHDKVCSENGAWEGLTPECMLKTCEVEPPKHGGFLPSRDSSSLKVGEKVRFYCKPHYRLLSDEEQECEFSGLKGKSVKCFPITCPFPILKHGSMEVPERGYFVPGDNATFRCHRYHQLSGPQSLQCTDNFAWDSDAIPICQPYHRGTGDCREPGTPPGGEQTRFDGQTVEYECEDGLILYGSNRSTCSQETGEWTEPPPVCRSKFWFPRVEEISQQLQRRMKGLGAVKAPENAERAITDVITDGAPVILYLVIDKSGSITQKDFKGFIIFLKEFLSKLRLFPLSEKNQLPVRVGVVTFDGAPHIELFPFEEKGDTFSGISTLLDDVQKKREQTDLRNSTNLNAAMEEVFNAIQTGKANNQADWNYHEDLAAKGVMVLTDGVYNDGGSPEENINKIKGEGYQIFAIAYTDTSDEPELKKMVTKETEDIYYLSNITFFSRLADEMLNNTIKYSCGESVVKNCDDVNDQIVGGKEVTAKQYPWMVRLYHDKDWDPADKKQAKSIGKLGKGGGTLITKQWVLTAGHNVKPPRDKDPWTADKILVAFGTKESRRSLVSKIIMHPEFTREGSLKHDVALLKLEKPIQFSEDALPACLPWFSDLPGQGFTPPQGDLLESGRMAHISGWAKSNTLQAACAEVKACPQDYGETVFCAGDEEHDTEQGDSGGPILRILRDSADNRRERFVQIGITSFWTGAEDPQAAQGAYADLGHFKDWVEEKIREE